MESHYHIRRSARYPVCFWIGVLLDEVLYFKVPASHATNDLITFLNLHVNTFLAKLVDAFGLPQEKYLKILPFRVLIQVLLELHINLGLIVANVDAVTLLQLI